MKALLLCEGASVAIEADGGQEITGVGMRVYVAVRESTWGDLPPYAMSAGCVLEEQAGRPDAVERWKETGRQVADRSFVMEVGDPARTLGAAFAARCWEEFLRRWHPSLLSPSPRIWGEGDAASDVFCDGLMEPLVKVRLYEPGADQGQLARSSTLSEQGLEDGDLLVLDISFEQDHLPELVLRSYFTTLLNPQPGQDPGPTAEFASTEWRRFRRSHEERSLADVVRWLSHARDAGPLLTLQQVAAAWAARSGGPSAPSQADPHLPELADAVNNSPLRASQSAMPCMVTPRNTHEALHYLQIAERARPVGVPLVWGVLLYTTADVELARYVRTHFEDLNVLSGGSTRILVFERRRRWPSAKRYWRQHLEPELFRVLSGMRWLQWTPYDPHAAYEFASHLGVVPDQLPCLVMFRASSEDLRNAEKIVFRIAHPSTAAFRALLGGITRALDSTPGLLREPRSFPQASRRPGTDHEDSPSDAAAALRELVTNQTYARLSITGSDTAVDTTATVEAMADGAFAQLRDAHQSIMAAVHATIPAPAALTIADSQVVINRGGTVPDSFEFHGENTTFINNPQNTLIQDFQNTHSTPPHADELAQLLHLILTSTSLEDSRRTQAAETVHELARLTPHTPEERAAATSRLQQLRLLLTSSADIATPALPLITSLTTLFGG
ncbi:hypothetical protein [Streptomyces sp. NPDC051921]|uniref:hypothetical protein n=1 Tax=Streptomyces sp. NPDC051921 TaxID=3155806 RepID=UPI003431C9FD